MMKVKHFLDQKRSFLCFEIFLHISILLHIRTFLYACTFFLSSLISVKSLCIFLYSRVNVYFYALIYVYLSMLSYLCISVFSLQQVGMTLVPVSTCQCVIFVNVNVCLFPPGLRLPYFCICLFSSFVYFSMFSYLCISVFNLRQVGKTLVPVSTCQRAAAAL